MTSSAEVTMLRLLLVSFVLVLTACGAANAPAARAYRFADLVARPESGAHVFEAPAILEFEPGDRLPLRLEFSDVHFALDPAAPPLALVAREHCFVRIDGR